MFKIKDNWNRTILHGKILTHRAIWLYPLHRECFKTKCKRFSPEEGLKHKYYQKL